MDRTRACSKSSFGLFNEKQCLVTLERLKRGDDKEKPKTEKVVAGKRLAVETEEERRTRLENDVAILNSWQLCLSLKLDVLSAWAPTTERNIEH